jgi:hypothetical protein
MELKSMKCSSKASDNGSIHAAQPEVPEYPYGLRLHLEKESLDQLGLETLPNLGAEIVIQAKVKVCGVSESKDMYGERRSLELQITDMAVGKPK